MSHLTDQPNLGKCCSCEEEGDHVRNVIALGFKKPSAEPGSGWGCFVCNLPHEGAIAVLCDDCLDNGEIRFVVDGYAEDNKRLPIDEVQATAEPHNHDMSFHQNEA